MITRNPLYLTFSRPRRVLEQIKGISEQKASKLLAEGKNPFRGKKSCC